MSQGKEPQRQVEVREENLVQQRFPDVEAEEQDGCDQTRLGKSLNRPMLFILLLSPV
jgi:hypothetical protein